MISHSTKIFERIERYVRNVELRFGRERLLRTISEVHIDYFSKHVDHYRVIVRTGEWPNEDRSTSFPIFCSEFERSAVAYINVGFDALDFLAGGATWPLEKLYQRAVASEALRGQFGKRSPSGLDQRLNRNVDKLISGMLKWLGDDTIHDQVNLLCTPTKPWLSAEAMLLEDFDVLRKSFPAPPSIDEIVLADVERQEIAWSFLRRHSRWSVEYMHHYYTDFDTPLFDKWLVNGRQQRKVLATQRHNLVVDISKSINFDAANEIMAMVNEITTLNQFNLAFEPCFSFKGGPGVAHGLIFKAAADSRLCMQTAHAQLHKDKWELFFATITEE
ncbi:MAG: hypothetical protein Q8O64_05170 [Sideroxyarcus sp.]|nr:hypothetical protein [Sideroxyarcus sp.]